MLEKYGHLYFHVADALATQRGQLYAWTLLHRDQRHIASSENGTKLVLAALQKAAEACDQVPLGKLRREIDRVIEENKKVFLVERCGIALRNISERFHDELEDKKFFYIPDDRVAFYGQVSLFGEDVAKKFKHANDDITQAGNCYAVGQPTACVFHLMRAMEVVVRRLGRRMDVRIDPNTTWRKITGDMDYKIKGLADATARQKEKKNRWEETRANLHHVGSVWRNNTMHPAKTYTPSQARDVIDACRVFMGGLCTL